MRYACSYLNDINESIEHAERVINGSSNQENVKYFIAYRFSLMKLLLKHQLLEFDRN